MTDKQFRFVVIGAGGIGSWLTPALTRMLEYRAPGSGLLIVDGDTYEPKNLERQTFSSMGNKASVLAKDLAGTFERTYIIPIPKWVVAEVQEPEPSEEKDDVEVVTNQNKIAADDLLNDNDVVFVVVDNDAARKLVFDTAAKLDNIDVFSGGNDERLFGSVYHYRRRNGEDVTINPTEMHAQYADPQDRNPGDLSCEERAKIEGGTQTIAANFGVATWILGRVQATIIEDQDITTHPHEIYFDLEKGMALGHDRSAEVQAEEEEIQLVATTA